MITRRDILRALAAEGLAVGLGSAALGQQSPRKSGSRRRSGRRPSDRNPAGGGTTKDQAHDSPPPHRLDDVLAPVRDEHHLPGLAGAILVGDRVAAIGATGIRKIGSSEPFLPTDQVHLGSCTKAMTATLIGMLVDDGKLTWKTTIGEVFGQRALHVHPDIQDVTLEQLLTHRAGLPHDVQWWFLSGRNTTEQRMGIVESMLTNPPIHPPGTRYEYSNVGYALAGLMAEVVAGQSWETMMQKRLFEPLGMTTAGFGVPGRRGTVEQPWGHQSAGGQARPVQLDNAPALGPAGTVHCSLADWGRFAALHLAAAQGKPRMLKAATFRFLHTPAPGSNYAGGWIVCQRTWAGGQALTHTGSNTTWMSTVWLAPARDFIFLASTNQGGKVAEKAVDDAIVALLRASQRLG